ncbi:hypothetical protein [Wolbachia endosymbiont of Dactylopius coccus]
MMSSQCLLLLSFQCSFFCHPSSPYDVIPVSISLSSQCPDYLDLEKRMVSSE